MSVLLLCFVKLNILSNMCQVAQHFLLRYRSYVHFSWGAALSRMWVIQTSSHSYDDCKSNSKYEASVALIL